MTSTALEVYSVRICRDCRCSWQAFFVTLGSGRRNAILFLYAASSGRNFVFAPSGVFKITIFSILSGCCIAHSIAYCPKMKPCQENAGELLA